MSAYPGDLEHPSLQLWDTIYAGQKDYWTIQVADEELLKFHDILTNGKSGLDILVPMCGRSQILLTLAEKGHRVVGIEWSEVAVKRFFKENDLPYGTQSYHLGGEQIPVYTANDKAITIYCGDLFSFKDDNLGGFDCIVDHGSIGCFDFTKVNTRETYASLMNFFMKADGRILLSIFDYEHSEHPSVPFAVTEEEIVKLYKENFQVPELLREFTTKEFYDTFHPPDEVFPVLAMSHFSWKLFLLVKL